MTHSVRLAQLHGPDSFSRRLAVDGQTLRREAVTTLQLNLGKVCNLACHHCHVEAGPGRTEIMRWDTMQRILSWLDVHGVAAGLRVVDLTGGAPEMNPSFRRLVIELKGRGFHVLDRCNLTVLLEDGQSDLADFLAEHQIEIVASLPCYLRDNVDQQRGRGVYDASIEALRRLNALGYGRGDRRMRLDLVYNPVGYGLPPEQDALEADYKRELLERFDIVFDRLWTLTNMPIRRFAHALRRDGQYDHYMKTLMASHNAANVASVMCRSLVSVGWRGTVYDCDFNQMLNMPVMPAHMGPEHDEHTVERLGRKLWEFHPDELIGRSIRSADHCFGCTAGAGSSCTGALE